jgi:hypothetical protein
MTTTNRPTFLELFDHRAAEWRRPRAFVDRCGAELRNSFDVRADAELAARQLERAGLAVRVRDEVAP